MGSYLIYLAIIIILPLYAQYKVKSTYNKYSKVRSTSGMTGAQAARLILDQNGLQNVKVVETKGFLSDHYNPATKVVALSTHNYHEASVAGTAVAAHEVGHAIQDQEAYSFLRLRHRLVPVASLTSNASWVFIMIGTYFFKYELVTWNWDCTSCSRRRFPTRYIASGVQCFQSSDGSNRHAWYHSKRRRSSREERC